ncbi:acyltransferase [Nissabacter sp. SGAir0207]|uniref:acyltransferase n=1 Tax=Nissabacter sp. SGAir0207 TaxID=2126321 RepID=UPI00143CE963|nr:acyltransferase family protein [Nissabacter sp. SGAir0207]
MEKNFNLEMMRAVAIYAVVLIHASMMTFYAAPIDGVAWSITNLCYSLARFCVPFFFMASAFLLIKEEMPVGAFLKRRLTRILLPLVAWSFIYGLLNGQDIFSRQWLIGTLLNQNAAGHLWFLYALVGLYIMMPLVGLLYYRSRSLFRWYAALTFVFSCAMPFLNEAFQYRVGFVGNMALDNFHPLVIYLFLPLLMRDLTFTRQRGWLALALFGLMTLIIFAGTRHISLAAHQPRETYYNYAYPPVVIASAALFYLLLNVRFTFSALWRQRILSVAECAFGIYLVHMVFLLLLGHVINVNVALVWPFGGLIFSVVWFLLTYALVRALRTVPYIRAIL